MAQKVRSWQDLENIVRIIASHLYDREAIAKTINGIKCDAVLEIDSDNYVLIEISKNDTLDKLRKDLAKFATLKQYYFLKNIYVKCIFICDKDLHPSIVETANGLHVEAMSLHQFSEKLFSFHGYSFARKQKSFGSAVDPVTGDNDNTEYTPVTYHIQNDGDVSIDEIANFLISGKYIVLTGEYGSGKSRCLRELFYLLTNKSTEIYKFPIHINLKENWGLKRSNEILSRHVGDLGIGRYLDSLIKVSDKPSICYLLDGFDEVGAQTWSDSPEKLKEIRRQSLSGVKDIIFNSRGGCIVSGREHYFKSHDELINCLGLEKKNPIIVVCKPEFSDDEVKNYLKGKSNIEKLPDWLPRKPLLCQIIKDIDVKDLQVLFKDDVAEFEFFATFLELIAEREARINNSLDKEVIKNVLVNLSQLVRKNENRFGPITINDLNKTFEEITGNTVADETAIILQRLPGLGRIDGNSHDRQFIDDYILSGLQAISTLQIFNTDNYHISKQKWRNSLSEWSIRYLASMYIDENIRSKCIHYFNANINGKNKFLLGDLLSSLTLLNDGCVNFNNSIADNLFYTVVDLSTGSISNISIDNGYIHKLIIEDKNSKGIIIKNACIEILEGVSSIEGCPNWMQNNIIESFQELNNLSQIKKSKLNHAQKLFIIITRKLFMQPGNGRKETALLKGYNSSEQKKLVSKILQVLNKQNLYEIVPGNEGKLYIPNRKMNSRIQRIHDELLLSKDDIWLQISKLK